MYLIFGIIGAVVGAGLGWFAFDWLLGYGMYTMILPGAMVGIGAGLASRRECLKLGLITGVAALALGIFLEWKYMPLVADESLSYFLQNLVQINPIHLIMIFAGGFAGYYFGKGRETFGTIAKSNESKKPGNDGP